MSKARLIILGCGGSAGVPQIGGADGKGDWGHCDPTEPRNRRSRSSIVIEHEQPDATHRLLVDTSPDIRSQLTDNGIGWVDSVIYTHPHADHIAGFDELRIINRVIQKPLPLYATAEALDQIKARFDYAFKPWKPPYFYHPVVEPQGFDFTDTLNIDGLEIRCFEQDHGSIRTLGMRMGDIAYCTDVATLDDRALDVLSGVKTWVVDCFQRKPLNTHAHPEKVVKWCQAIKPERVVITHMGFDMDWAWMQANLPAPLEPAFDGMILEFNPKL